MGEGWKLSKELSRTYGEFLVAPTNMVAAMRAERLVLALDRLSHTLGSPALKELGPELTILFALVQARADFDGKKFSESVLRFHQLVSNVPR